MSMLKEFKEFAMRGNVIDLAVGVVIGGAFGKIVSSLVSDIIMPPIGALTGGVDFSDLVFTIKAATPTTKAVAINYGLFINNIINFGIVAFSIFMMVKVINSLKRPQPHEPPPPTEKKCPECQLNIPINAKRCAHCTSVLA